MPWAVIKSRPLTLMQGQYIVEHVGPSVRVGDEKGGEIVHIFKRESDALAERNKLNRIFYSRFLKL